MYAMLVMLTIQQKMHVIMARQGHQIKDQGAAKSSHRAVKLTQALVPCDDDTSAAVIPAHAAELAATHNCTEGE